MLIRAKHFETNERVDIHCERGKIEAVQPAGDAPPDLGATWVAPAFFDLQINGCDGKSFSSELLTVDAVRHIVRVCRRHGIAALCPTLVTNSFAALYHGMSVLLEACEDDAELAYSIPAFHLEGPYISPEDGPRGAHPKQHVRPPDWEEFRRLQDAAGGRIRLLTLAPEWPNATSFIEKLVNNGVVVAIGHTAAGGQQIRDAIKAGASLSTHLGNGSHAMLHRHHNYIWEQLAADELWASVICDGHHLPSAVVKCIVRMKSAARIILTCDASSLAGLPPGRYREWEQDFDVLPGGKVTVSGTSYLAGSGVFTDVCVDKVMTFAEVEMPSAIEMAGAQPRKLLDQPTRTLEAGQPADLILFDWTKDRPFQLKTTLVQGKVAT